MTRQRKHGVPVTFYPRHLVTDSRGNEQWMPNLDAPIQTTAAVYAQRSSKAEVPGQQEIEVTRLLVRADLPDVNLWARATFLGQDWDIAAPPAYHHGTRTTRHISVDLRRRPY